MTTFPFAIHYEKDSRSFHLQNDQVSYLMTVDEEGKLLQLYFGKPIVHKENFDYLIRRQAVSMSASVRDFDATFSYEIQKQEFPDFGGTDLRSAAVKIESKNGATVTDFRYQGHEIFAGKKSLAGLPASYVENEQEALTLEIYLQDQLTNIQATLSYTLFAPEFGGVIARSVALKNHGSQTVAIKRLFSLNLDLPDANYNWLQLSGAWSKERSLEERPLTPGIQSIYSLRGHSSAQHNPFACLKRPHTTETQGEAIGVTFVYSSNFLLQADVDTRQTTRLQLGIHPEGFSWQLTPGASFQAPEALLVFSSNGLNEMSQTFHRLLSKRVARGYWRDRPRPILLNNWEATYFDFNEEKLLRIAKTAKEVGAEVFVLDDGWFGRRTSDRIGLGDWRPNLERLPEGISGLSKKITEMGLQFGLWIEPEMVNADSQLFEDHPDWIIQTPGRHASQSRFQYVLNFARKEVVDHIHQQLVEILRNSTISYIKWDMNRSMSEVYDNSRQPNQQGEIYHRYILGVYDLYERLTSEFPEILFESCASGGGRFDAGMLYYAPQAWASDNNDAICRLKIQYGTSMAYPIASIGAHVASVPNHTVGRITPLTTRANVAMFGTFGYELDLNQLTSAEQRQVQEQIIFMKKYRQLLQFGTFYRLRSPFGSIAGGLGDGNETAWMVVSPDQKTAIVGFYRVLNRVDLPFDWLKLAGLTQEKNYQILNCNKETSTKETSITYSGAELMNLGLDVTTAASTTFGAEIAHGDFTSKLWVLQEK